MSQKHGHFIRIAERTSDLESEADGIMRSPHLHL
jgi:hypothetical protein